MNIFNCFLMALAIIHVSSFFWVTHSDTSSPSYVMINHSSGIDSNSSIAFSALKLKSFSTSALLSKRPTSHPSSWFTFSLLLLAGDLEVNPGPNYKYPCGSCSRPCKKNQDSILCDDNLKSNSSKYNGMDGSRCSPPPI